MWWLIGPQGASMWMDTERGAIAQKAFAIRDNPSMIQSLLGVPLQIRWPIYGEDSMDVESVCDSVQVREQTLLFMIVSCEMAGFF